MKKVLAIALIGLVAAAAEADLSLNWLASAGFYFSGNPSSGILGSGESTIAQLIYSADNVIDAAFAGGATSGNDTVLDSLLLTEGGNTSEWGDFAIQYYTDTFTAGWAYVRIFEDSVVDVGDAYYSGPMVALQDLDLTAVPKPTPQDVQANSDLINGDALDQVVAVPEPATLALYAIGALVIGVSRRRRK
jgi:hypothetical protein